MEINVKYSSEGAEKFKIEVPIEGLKYKTLKISGSTSLDYGKEEFIISNKICLQSIQTVIFDDFAGSCEFLQKISNLKHLKILKRFCDYWTFDLNNLTHLELMLEDLRDTKILQDQNVNFLITFFFSFFKVPKFLKLKSGTLKELKLRVYPNQSERHTTITLYVIIKAHKLIA